MTSGLPLGARLPAHQRRGLRSHLPRAGPHKRVLDRTLRARTIERSPAAPARLAIRSELLKHARNVKQRSGG
jgi:hypothetical protein